MNSKFWMVLSASLLAVLWTWGGNPLSYDASAAQSSQSQVVVIICSEDGFDPLHPIIVQRSSSSAGAPAVPAGPGNGCAQGLASVLAAGFQLSSNVNAGMGVQYTLIK